MKNLRSLGFAVGVALFMGCLQTARASPADLQFNQLVDDFVFGTLSLAPTTATGMGYHRHRGVLLDDQLEDFSPAGIKASLNLLSEIEMRIGTLDAKSFNQEQRADINIMHGAIAAARLDLQDIQSYRHNPTLYVELIGNALYTPYVLHYAATEERFKHIISRLNLIPQLVRQAKENLQDSPELWNKVAREENGGNVDLIEGVLRADCPAALVADYTRAAAPALDALRGFNIWLDGTLSKKTADWRLGKKRYAQKFSFVLATGKTPEALLEEAEADLAKTRDEITVKEIEDTTGANRNTIEMHVKKLAEQHYLIQACKGRGARYTIK